eukprot:TRINITY_DN21265_c0_g1_i1.p2 TRINITY_DN21265_c0_g1~~TRINITY_DN21265_c0_g1_i1.p2  ORF type:complete len:218 (+),score=55.50 TRINITY_DN21265_c0_g1_i1:133-786(+)
MCIRDSINAEYGGKRSSAMGANCCKSAMAAPSQDTVVNIAPAIVLTAQRKGTNVNLGASLTQLAGSGVALCSTKLDQDRAYWEVTVNSEDGECWVGVAGKAAAVEKCPGAQVARGDQDTAQLWGLHSADLQSHAFAHLKKGDTIGVLYDQACGPPTLEFFYNGNVLDGARISHIRGQVTPAVAVQDGGLDCNFTHTFAHPPLGQHSSDGIIAASGMI